MTTHVWLAQCLCPARHAIFAAAGEADADDPSDAQTAVLGPLRQEVNRLLTTKVVNPWCGLCRAPARAWTYEVRRTRFATMDEATPALLQLEAEQIMTADLWTDIPRSD